MLITVICINPPPYRDRPYKAWRLRDAPEAIAARAAAEAEANPSTKLSERVADSLVVYQRELLDALEAISNMTGGEEHVGDRGELGPGAGPGAGSGKSGGKSAAEKRLAALERGDKELRAELSNLNRAINTLSGNVAEGAEVRGPILKAVYNAVRDARTRSNPAERGNGSEARRGRGRRQAQRDGGRDAGAAERRGATAGAVSVGVVLSLGAVLALALTLLRRWRRSTAKGLKSR